MTNLANQYRHWIAEGKTPKQIAELRGVTLSTVCSTLRRYNIHHKETCKHDATILKLYRKGAVLEDVIEATGLSQSHITQICRRLEIRTFKRKHNKSKLRSEEIRREYKTALAEGLTPADIASRRGIHPYSASAFIRRLREEEVI